MRREDADGPPALTGPQAQALLDEAPCAMIATDPDGFLIYANHTLKRWLDRPGLLDNDKVRLPDLLTTPGRIFYETHVAPMLHLQGHVREIACHLKGATSDTLPVLLNGVARQDAAGKIDRIDFVLFDARERASYEQALREAQQESETLADIVRASPNAIARTTGDGRVRSWNRAAEIMTGQSAKAAIGEPIDQMLCFQDQPDWFRTRRTELAKNSVLDFEARLESAVDLDVTMAKIGESFSLEGGSDFVFIMRDITVRKQAERDLSLMVREMNHRVKNTLTIVSAMARQTLHSEESEAFSERLFSLSKAHDVLTRSYWGAIDLVEIVNLTREEAGGRKRLDHEGPPVRLAPRQATSFAMLLHELVTNALKYGALSVPEGHVELRYELTGPDDNRQFRLTWREIGGPPVEPPGQTGFGSTLINTLFTAEFNAQAEVEFAPDGFRCALEFAYKPPPEN